MTRYLLKPALSLAVLLSIVFFAACERPRTNEFDVFDEDYASPPAGDAMVTAVHYDPGSGFLDGVQMTIFFVDPLPRAFSVRHVFYMDITPVDTLELTYDRAISEYTIQIMITPAFPLGNYSLRYYWGDIAINACMFTVVEFEGKKVLKTNEKTAVFPDVDFTPDIRVDM